MYWRQQLPRTFEDTILRHRRQTTDDACAPSRAVSPAVILQLGEGEREGDIQRRYTILHYDRCAMRPDTL